MFNLILGNFEKSKSGKVKLKVQSGTAVEPESGLVDIAHVYRKKNEVYTVTLGLTDIQSDKNSFYKLQLLESDSVTKKRFVRCVLFYIHKLKLIVIVIS